MKTFAVMLALLPLLVVLPNAPSVAQVSLTSIGTPYTQDFNTLAISGASSVLPAGWLLSESGPNANTTYTAGNGNNSTGETWAYGVTGSTERALGGLQSASLIPMFGASFMNNTGSTITSLLISYTGECWRLGTNNRFDSLFFQLTLDGTSLTTGTWTKYTDLSFATPDTSFGTGLGQRDGNASANKRMISGTISGLNIASGATFWIRWTDFNATGADDGLAIDDFSLTPESCTAPGASATGGTLTCVNTAVILSANTASNGSSFSWSGPGILIGGLTANPTVTASGTYVVTVTTSVGGCSSSATASVNANNVAPGATAAGGILTCAATSATLSASTSTGTSFEWAGQGIVSGGNSANPVVSSSGTYTVTVTNSATGCTSTASALVSSNVSAPGASATGGMLTCTITSCVLSAASAGGTSYAWSGPGISAGGSSANPTVTASGTYVVTVANTATGCSSTAQALVNRDCGGQTEFLTFGQGFYGNAGGRECSQQRTTIQLLTDLLSAGDIRIGVPGRSLTFRQSSAASDAACIISRLPSGGPSQVLPTGDAVLGASCTPTTAILLKNGRFHNSLLGQTITLALNIRLNPALGGVVLADHYMTTQAVNYVDGICLNGNDLPLPDTERSYEIPTAVLAALGTNNTVNDLLALANLSLAAGTNVSKDAILDAVGALNSAFEGARRLVGFTGQPTAPLQLAEQGETIDANPTEYALSVNYPNPFNPATVIEFALPEKSTVKLIIYDLLGREVARLIDGVMERGTQSVVWDATDRSGRGLSSGIYVSRLSASSVSSGKQFDAVRRMMLVK